MGTDKSSVFAAFEHLRPIRRFTSRDSKVLRFGTIEIPLNPPTTLWNGEFAGIYFHNSTEAGLNLWHPMIGVMPWAIGCIR